MNISSIEECPFPPLYLTSVPDYFQGQFGVIISGIILIICAFIIINVLFTTGISAIWGFSNNFAYTMLFSSSIWATCSYVVHLVALFCAISYKNWEIEELWRIIGAFTSTSSFMYLHHILVLTFHRLMFTIAPRFTTRIMAKHFGMITCCFFFAIGCVLTVYLMSIPKDFTILYAPNILQNYIQNYDNKDNTIAQIVRGGNDFALVCNIVIYSLIFIIVQFKDDVYVDNEMKITLNVFLAFWIERFSSNHWTYVPDAPCYEKHILLLSIISNLSSITLPILPFFLLDKSIRSNWMKTFMSSSDEIETECVKEKPSISSNSDSVAYADSTVEEQTETCIVIVNVLPKKVPLP